MQRIEYTYNSPAEIISNIKLIDDFSYIILIILIIVIIVITRYLLPILYIFKDYLKSQKEKRKKSSMLKKIILQKEIEDSILKEVVEKKEMDIIKKEQK